jgi:hypothetical protein
VKPCLPPSTAARPEVYRTHFPVRRTFGTRFRRVWCGRRDLNPHGRSHQNLNLACLPIPPRPHGAERLKPTRRGLTRGMAEGVRKWADISARTAKDQCPKAHQGRNSDNSVKTGRFSAPKRKKASPVGLAKLASCVMERFEDRRVGRQREQSRRPGVFRDWQTAFTSSTCIRQPEPRSCRSDSAGRP